MDKEIILSRKVIYEGRILKLNVASVRMPDGRRATREIVEHDPCVAVIALDADGNILLVKQYRLATGKELLEIPAGGIDPGENPERAVIREMREETGFRPDKVERMTGFYLSPGFSSEFLHLFLATNLVIDPLSAEDTFGIEVKHVPVQQVRELIASGKIADAKSVAGLLMYLECKTN